MDVHHKLRVIDEVHLCPSRQSSYQCSEMMRVWCLRVTSDVQRVGNVKSCRETSGTMTRTLRGSCLHSEGMRRPWRDLGHQTHRCSHESIQTLNLLKQSYRQISARMDTQNEMRMLTSVTFLTPRAVIPFSPLLLACIDASRIKLDHAVSIRLPLRGPWEPWRRALL